MKNLNRVILVDVIYHFDGAEGEDAVIAPAVGPGIPARILALLQHELLTLTAGLLVPHPPTHTHAQQQQLQPFQDCLFPPHLLT